MKLHKEKKKNVSSLERVKKFDHWAYPFISLREHLFNRPKEILDKSYLNKSLVMLVTKFKDEDMIKYYHTVEKWM